MIASHIGLPKIAGNGSSYALKITDKKSMLSHVKQERKGNIFDTYPKWG